MSIEVDEGGKRFELSVDRVEKNNRGMRLSAGEDEKDEKDEKEEKGKEEQKKEDSADSKVSKKADVVKSVAKNPEAEKKDEPKAESQYQNLDAKLPPELKTPVVEQKPSETKTKSIGKKKKSNPCCTIL